MLRRQSSSGNVNAVVGVGVVARDELVVGESRAVAAVGGAATGVGGGL